MKEQFVAGCKVCGALLSVLDRTYESKTRQASKKQRMAQAEQSITVMKGRKHDQEEKKSEMLDEDSENIAGIQEQDHEFKYRHGPAGNDMRPQSHQ